MEKHNTCNYADRGKGFAITQAFTITFSSWINFLEKVLCMVILHQLTLETFKICFTLPNKLRCKINCELKISGR